MTEYANKGIPWLVILICIAFLVTQVILNRKNRKRNEETENAADLIRKRRKAEQTRKSDRPEVEVKSTGNERKTEADDEESDGDEDEYDEETELARWEEEDALREERYKKRLKSIGRTKSIVTGMVLGACLGLVLHLSFGIPIGLAIAMGLIVGLVFGYGLRSE